MAEKQTTKGEYDAFLAGWDACIQGGTSPEAAFLRWNASGGYTIPDDVKDAMKRKEGFRLRYA